MIGRGRSLGRGGRRSPASWSPATGRTDPPRPPVVDQPSGAEPPRSPSGGPSTTARTAGRRPRRLGLGRIAPFRAPTCRHCGRPAHAPDSGAATVTPTHRPYVGRPVMLSDAASGDWPPGPPSAAYVWLDSDSTRRDVDLGNGYIQETVDVGGAEAHRRHRRPGAASADPRVGSARASCARPNADRSRWAALRRRSREFGDLQEARVCAYRTTARRRVRARRRRAPLDRSDFERDGTERWTQSPDDPEHVQGRRARWSSSPGGTPTPTPTTASSGCATTGCSTWAVGSWTSAPIRSRLEPLDERVRMTPGGDRRLAQRARPRPRCSYFIGPPG